MLADMGAEVIKVESSPGINSGSPWMGPILQFQPEQEGNRPQPESQRGKRDRLKTGQGGRCSRGELFARLHGPAGIGIRERVPDQPRIIYCSISGFGQSGLSGNRPAYEPILQPCRASWIPRASRVALRSESDRLWSIIAPGPMPLSLLPGIIRPGKDRTRAKDRCCFARCGPLCMAPYVTQFLRKGELPSGGVGPALRRAIQNFETGTD